MRLAGLEPSALFEVGERVKAYYGTMRNKLYTATIVEVHSNGRYGLLYDGDDKCDPGAQCPETNIYPIYYEPMLLYPECSESNL